MDVYIWRGGCPIGRGVYLGGGSFPVSLREGVLLVRKDPDKGVHTRKITLYGKCPVKESA